MGPPRRAGEPSGQNAYHEPGGSLSPSPGSFGVSLWAMGAGGEVAVTSDTVALDQIQQRYEWGSGSPVPAIVTRTPFYQCSWTAMTGGQWRLTVAGVPPDRPLEVVIRSVGPAGGPLETVHWDGSRLLLNRRWVAGCEPSPVAVGVGSEEEPGWRRASQARASHADADGWCYARLRLAPGRAHTLTLRDTAPQFRGPLAFERVGPACRLGGWTAP